METLYDRPRVVRYMYSRIYSQLQETVNIKYSEQLEGKFHEKDQFVNIHITSTLPSVSVQPLQSSLYQSSVKW